MNSKREMRNAKCDNVRGHYDDNGNDRADALVQWGKESGPYARGYEGGGEGESRLRGDGTEGAKAIEDQRKAKAATLEAEKERESLSMLRERVGEKKKTCRCGGQKRGWGWAKTGTPTTS